MHLKLLIYNLLLYTYYNRFLAVNESDGGAVSRLGLYQTDPDYGEPDGTNNAINLK